MKKINKVQNQPSRPSIIPSDSKEYGATQSAILFARKIKLDLLISPKNVDWSKDILALIIGKLIHREVDETLLFNTISDNLVWKLCGHQEDVQLNNNKNYFKSLEKLLSKQEIIQKRIANKKLLKAKANQSTIHSNTPKDHSTKSKLIFSYWLNSLNIFTTHEGCPIALDIFIIEPSIHELNNDLSNNHFWNQSGVPIIYICDLHSEDINKITDDTKKLNIIGRLSQSQIRELINKNILNENLNSKRELIEVTDPRNSSICYLVIDQQNVIYVKLEDQSLSQTEILSAYTKKMQLQEFFKNQIVYLKNARPYPLDISSHPTDNQARALSFLLLLVHYLEWHIEQKLIKASQDEKNDIVYYTPAEAIEKLKSIKSQVLKIELDKSAQITTSLNEEQQKIIDALGINLLF